VPRPCSVPGTQFLSAPESLIRAIRSEPGDPLISVSRLRPPSVPLFSRAGDTSCSCSCCAASTHPPPFLDLD
jgi:hypothetical protein